MVKESIHKKRTFMRDSDDFYAALGAAIRAKREQHELTQADLSHRVGLSRTSITNIERGRQRLLADQLQRVAATLDVSVDELLPRSQSASSPRASAQASDLKTMPTVARFVESALADLRGEGT